MSIIICGDLHLKSGPPFWEAQQELLKWLNENFINNPLILLGDCFDSSSPMWHVYSEFKDFLMKRKSITYILQGNHSLSKRKGSALEGLHLLENVKIFFEQEEFEIEGHKCLFMPHVYGDLKETYEKEEGEFDFIFTHLMPWFAPFSQETGIKFSKNLKGTFIHGHEHINAKYENHIVIGTPFVTRHKEQDKDFHIIEIKKDKELVYHDVPQYFTYETIEYGQEPTNKNNIYNIINAPSILDVYSKYNEYYIRRDGIKLKINEDTEETLSFDASDLKQEFKKFSKEENIDKELENTCLQYL